MVNPKSGCLICGQELQYFNPAKKMRCDQCGEFFETTATCLSGHFVCHTCHAQAAYGAISSLALASQSKDPLTLAREMMGHSTVNMHGPEHHFLVAAALLTAYKNSGGVIDLVQAVELARKRGQQVPGGICGFWGCCGAGVGTGIFISLITGATPLSGQEWGLANAMTSASLQYIARNGGPRCCKRNTYLAILAAVDYVQECLDLALEKPTQVTCEFFWSNPSCRRADCLFFPG